MSDISEKLDLIHEQVESASLEELLLRRSSLESFVVVIRGRERDPHETESRSHLRRQRKKAGGILARINWAISSKREERRTENVRLSNAAREEFYQAYYRCARALLTEEVHMNIYAEATRILGREFTEKAS